VTQILSITAINTTATSTTTIITIIIIISPSSELKNPGLRPCLLQFNSPSDITVVVVDGIKQQCFVVCQFPISHLVVRALRVSFACLSFLDFA